MDGLWSTSRCLYDSIICGVATLGSPPWNRLRHSSVVSPRRIYKPVYVYQFTYTLLTIVFRKLISLSLLKHLFNSVYTIYNTMSSTTVSASLPKLAKLIDHSLLHPTMTDAEITAGLELSRAYGVASACVKPYSVPLATKILAGSGVLVCAVVGFPHGNSTESIKISEAVEAIDGGSTEIDVVVNVGKVLGGEWSYVEHEIDAVNRAVTSRGAILKVIFENDYLEESHIIRLCEMCTKLRVAFVKTSSGYGFVKQDNGMYNYKGATIPHLKLMREHSGPDVQIKAAGGVRTLDDLLYVMSLGVTRVGATATKVMLEEAKARGIGENESRVEVKSM